MLLRKKLWELEKAKINQSRLVGREVEEGDREALLLRLPCRRRDPGGGRDVKVVRMIANPFSHGFTLLQLSTLHLDPCVPKFFSPSLSFCSLIYRIFIRVFNIDTRVKNRELKGHGSACDWAKTFFFFFSSISALLFFYYNYGDWIFVN